MVAGPLSLARHGISRSPTDRIIAGLAGGIARRVGIDAALVRAAFVVLAFAGGVGVALYLVGWAVTGTSASQSRDEDGPGVEASAMPGPQQLALGLVVLGVLLLLREVGLWLGDGVVWPVALVSFGFAVMWATTGETARARWAQLAFAPSEGSIDLGMRVSASRAILGSVLIMAGVGVFFAALPALEALGSVVLAVLITAGGLTVVFGPWMWQLIRQLSRERRERIRSEERAEMAAHLHDSVLQTLAQIQRSGDPQSMAVLARSQERELRAWLYGKARDGEDRLGSAIDALAARVEREHQVAVEAITVGDCDMDERTTALLQAAAEAMTNAATHSGAPKVSVYMEVEQGSVTAYVSDEGSGFDAATVPADRRGIAESIEGRMARHGGEAAITSQPGEGTEVKLTLPGARP